MGRAGMEQGVISLLDMSHWHVATHWGCKSLSLMRLVHHELHLQVLVAICFALKVSDLVAPGCSFVGKAMVWLLQCRWA